MKASGRQTSYILYCIHTHTPLTHPHSQVELFFQIYFLFVWRSWPKPFHGMGWTTQIVTVAASSITREAPVRIAACFAIDATNIETVSTSIFESFISTCLSCAGSKLLQSRCASKMLKCDQWAKPSMMQNRYKSQLLYRTRNRLSTKKLTVTLITQIWPCCCFYKNSFFSFF